MVFLFSLTATRLSLCARPQRGHTLKYRAAGKKTAGQKFKPLVAASLAAVLSLAVWLVGEPAAWLPPPGEEQSYPRRCRQTAAERCCGRA
jgi:hypothetical protein